MYSTYRLSLAFYHHYYVLLLLEFEAKFLRKLIMSLNERPTENWYFTCVVSVHLQWELMFSRHKKWRGKHECSKMYNQKCHFWCVCRKCIEIYDLCGVYTILIVVVQSNGKSIPLIYSGGVWKHHIVMCVYMTCNYEGCHFLGECRRSESFLPRESCFFIYFWIIRLLKLKRFLNRDSLS